MLDSNVNAFAKDPVPNTLVDLNADCALGDIPDATGLSVVKLVWHTLLDGTISDNINNVTELISLGVLAELNCAVASELLLEDVAGGGSVTERVGHLKKRRMTTFQKYFHALAMCDVDQHTQPNAKKL